MTKPTRSHLDNVRLRAVQLGDHAEVCVPFLRDSFAQSFGSGEVFERTFQSGGEGYLAWLQSWQGVALHAWLDGRAVGELMYDPDQAYLQHIYVVAEQRGSGLANLLHGHFVRALGSSRRSQATLKVSRSNHRAIRFYKRHGWHLVAPDQRDPKLDVYALPLA